MKIGKTFRCTDRAQWREWLSANFETESEIWFVFPIKASGECSVTYNDAVEEALCFGWIDGQAAALDETHQVRRFRGKYSSQAMGPFIWAWFPTMTAGSSGSCSAPSTAVFG